MATCCGSSRGLTIEATFLRVDGETCDRCETTCDSVREAARKLKAMLEPVRVPVTLIEHDATADQLADSNTVLINGRPLEEWLGAQRVTTACPSCGELIGESACCSAVAVDGEVHEALTPELVMSAALAALGIGGAGCCC